MILLVAAGLAIACGTGSEPVPSNELWVAPDIASRRAQFVPQTLTAAVDHLSEGDRQALRHLVEAAEAMNEIYLRQAWAGNPEFAGKVSEFSGQNSAALRDYYRIMYGPWDRLLDHGAFVGVFRPKGAGYYPEDLTADEFEAWLDAHPEDRGAFTSLHTMIRRDGDRGGDPVQGGSSRAAGAAAEALRAAAAATENESLRSFLELRARRLRHRRLLRVGHGVDGPGLGHRGRHRTLRDLRGRPLRLQGGLRELRLRHPSRRLGEAGEFKEELPFLEAICRSPTSTRTSTAAPSRRSGWPTRSTPPATPGPGCRPSPSTCPTTSACARPRAPRRCCSRT